MHDVPTPPSDEPPPGELVLRLRIDAGEPPAGWIEADGEVARRFAGWVGLLSAIGDARAHANHTDDGMPPPPKDHGFR